MKNIRKRSLSIFLSLFLTLTLVPMGVAFGAGEDETDDLVSTKTQNDDRAEDASNSAGEGLAAGDFYESGIQQDNVACDEGEAQEGSDETQGSGLGDGPDTVNDGENAGTGDDPDTPDTVNDDDKAGAADDPTDGEGSNDYVLLGMELNEQDTLSNGVELQSLAAENIKISYSAHIESIGWQVFVNDGEVAGTTGRALRLEGLMINLQNTTGIAGGIKYSAHVQNIGWQEAVEVTTTGNSSSAAQGGLSGTTGKALRLEALRIELTGDLADYYDVYYRVHVQNVGWMGWAKNGGEAGSAGYALRAEALQLTIVLKSAGPPSLTLNGVTVASGTPRMIDLALAQSLSKVFNSSVHIQNIGDRSYTAASGSTVLGTTGVALRLEAIALSLDDPSSSLMYRTFIQDFGWQGWVSYGDLSGTTGRGLRMETIEIILTGAIASTHDVYYRAHVQNRGWLGWAKNGQSCGSIGYNFRLEALQICIVEKGGVIPAVAGNSFFQRVIDPNKPMIAITIDGGPSTYSIGFVDVLNKYGARGTFFIVGQYVNSSRNELIYIANSDHEIGNHSYTHPDFTILSSTAIRNEVSSTNSLIESVTGIRPTVMRPPYGSRNSNVSASVGMPMILWSVDTLDWSTGDSYATARAIMGARDGDIVLIHDIPSSVYALDMALAELSRQGYQFVTVSELAYYKGYTMSAGSSYSSFR